MIIKKSELLDALSIVKPGLSNKEIIEQSTSFAFIGGRVVTYNDEISVSHLVPSLDIEGAIKAEELYKLLSKINTQDIEITLKESEILIKAGRVKAGLTLVQEVTLPIDELGQIDNWKSLPTNFIKHLRFVSSCCTNDMSKPILTCVNVKKDGVVQASDGYRLVEATLNKPMPVKDFLIPASAVAKIAPLEPTHISSGTGWVHFKKGETIISCRIFEETYPDISNHLVVKNIKKVEFPKTLADILERASVFSKRDHFLDEEVTVILSEGRVTVKGNSDAGWFQESSKIDYTSEPIEIKVTPYLLKTVLDKTLSAEIGKDKIKFSGEDWQYIAMLRIKEEKA